MSDNPNVAQQHVEVLTLLQQIADEPSEAPFGSAQNRQIARMRMRAERAIAALEAQGEARVVAYRWKRDGEVVGGWLDGTPSDRQFAAAESCKHLAVWTVEYAYTNPPAPQGVDAVTEEIVDAARDYFTGWCQDEADDDGPHFTGCSQEQHEAAKRLKAALASRTGKGEANGR